MFISELGKQAGLQMLSFFMSLLGGSWGRRWLRWCYEAGAVAVVIVLWGSYR